MTKNIVNNIIILIRYIFTCGMPIWIWNKADVGRKDGLFYMLFAIAFFMSLLYLYKDFKREKKDCR